jgi:hypothetical protein
MGRLLAWEPRSEAYWAALREVARQTEPELALAQHLAEERRRLFRWYPYGEAWRGSDAYRRACDEFEQHVLNVLAGEGEEANGGTG